MYDRRRINNILNHYDISSSFFFLVGTLTIPVMIDSKQVRVSSIPSGIVGQPIIFTSKFIHLFKF